jgi:hypothetical protein
MPPIAKYQMAKKSARNGELDLLPGNMVTVSSVPLSKIEEGFLWLVWEYEVDMMLDAPCSIWQKWFLKWLRDVEASIEKENEMSFKTYKRSRRASFRVSLVGIRGENEMSLKTTLVGYRR